MVFKLLTYLGILSFYHYPIELSSKQVWSLEEERKLKTFILNNKET